MKEVFTKNFIEFLGKISFKYYQTYGLPQDMFLEYVSSSNSNIEKLLSVYYGQSNNEDFVKSVMSRINFGRILYTKYILEDCLNLLEEK